MAIGTPQATTTSYADIYRATNASVAGSDVPALASATGIITGDVGYFRVTFLSGQQNIQRIDLDGQQISFPIIGEPTINPITVIEVKGDAGGGVASVDALRYV